QMNLDLERRVAERTSDFERTNLGVAAEIKLRREAEDRLVQAQKMEAIGRLAGGLAHDFNKLVTGKLGYNTIFKRKIGPEDPSVRLVNEVQHAAEQAGLVTAQLLAFSRKQVIKARVLDLNTSIRDMQAVLQRLIGEDVQLTVKLDPSVYAVKAD